MTDVTDTIIGVTLANAIAIKSLGDDVVRNTCSLARMKYLTLEKTSLVASNQDYMEGENISKHLS